MITRQAAERIALAVAGILLLLGSLGGLALYRAHRAYEVRKSLWVAVGEGDARRIAALLAEGGDPGTVGPNGTTALIAAAQRRDLPLARRLLREGADANAATVSGRQTAPMQAAALGDPSMAALLLAGGADVNARDWTGLTPLMFAAGSGSAATVRVLVAAGADVRARDREGSSAASRARRRGWTRVAVLLAEAKARQVAGSGRGPLRAGR